MASGTMMSRVLGLFRDIITAAYFDRTVTDAWIVAFRLPNLFRRMLGEGSFSISFIPIFVESIEREGPLDNNPRARKLLNGMFTLLLLFLSILTTLGVIFAETILKYLVGGEGFMAVPEKFEITVYMAKIMFSFLFFICLFAYFMAILNSFKKFAAAAFAPSLFNIALISSALFPQQFHVKGDTLAWAVLIGGFLEMAFLIPSLIKIGALPKITSSIWSPDIAHVFRGLIPSWIGVGILQLTALINVRLGSELSEGTHSWIYLADRILELPLSLIAVSLSSALLPTLSQLWAQGRREEMVSTSERYLRGALFLSIPAAVGVFMLAEPIVRVLFGHGRFSSTDLEVTSSLLRIYSVAILTYGGIRVIVSPFYAIKNTWLPAAVAGICLVVHFFLASNLIRSWGVQGITASSVITSTLNLFLLVVSHRILIGPFHVKLFAVCLSKYILAAVGMGLVLMIHDPFYETLSGVLGMPKIAGQVSLALVVASGAATYFAISFFVKAEGMEEVVGKIGKIRRKLRI